MSNKQQPECPAEYAKMTSGVVVRIRNGRRVFVVEPPKQIMGIWRVRTHDDQWRVCAHLTTVPIEKLTEWELNHSRLESLRAHLEEAEARASKAEAKLAQVKALLDGVGPVMGELRRDDTFKDSHWEFRESLGSCMILDIGPCMVVDNKKTVIAMYLSNYMAAEIVSNYNKLPALLSTLSEIWGVLERE